VSTCRIIATRRLIAEYLNEKWGGIGIQHLGVAGASSF
jgi:hypothetical protein